MSGARFDVSPFRVEYPFASHRLEVRPGVSLHYVDEGQGPPLVFLHGNPTWSFHFRDLIKGLRGAHRCVAPDHVGMGLSDVPDDAHYSYRLQSRVEDVEALLDHLKLESGVTLVVHDWGGMIGLAVALRRLPRIRRLVVFNTAGFGLPAGRGLPWQIAVVRGVPLSPLWVQGLNAFVLGANRACSTRGLSPLVQAAYAAPYHSWETRRAVQRFVEDIPLAEGDPSFSLVQQVSAQLEKLRQTPVLLCWGGQDFVFDRHFLAEWRRRVPHARVHEFPAAGHYVVEDAHEAILPLMRTFLEET